ncbi:PQQ-dependent sugar dehydrogenase [Thaumasiovibrio sp. DFM-14]|uniref:PQQ-dependent sugar dehydrogenase n=1 Tax=Thaumasiovibrio sp. DFM-14 TaxID=3384792 RepID=UPI00399FC0D4
MKKAGLICGLLAALIVSGLAYGWQAEKVASGLTIPWGIAYINETTLLVTERVGTIRQVDVTTGEHQWVGEIPNVWAEGQGGLLDIAVSPFHRDQIYVTYSKNVANQGATTLARAAFRDGKISDWQDLFVSISETSTSRHFGSRITFDSESIYLSIGDRGVRDNGQNTQTHAGSIVRLTPDGGLPRDNPYIDNPAILDEIWSYGHRNPQGLFYDAVSQTLWSNEHGPRGGDEINLIRRGANYGWPITSHGKEYWGPIKVGEATEKAGIVSPVKVYIPSIAPGDLILYRGAKHPELEGKLLSSALKLMHINVVTIKKAGDETSDANAETRILTELGERIRALELTPDGDLYFSTDSGNLYRLER